MVEDVRPPQILPLTRYITLGVRGERLLRAGVDQEVSFHGYRVVLDDDILLSTVKYHRRSALPFEDVGEGGYHIISRVQL
jgi:hypothetical protein